LGSEIALTNKSLLEDLNVTALALEQDDYDNMNIFANRIMSDATIVSDNKLLLIGFFLKDVATEMMELTATKKASALATAKTHASAFVSKMKELAKQKDFEEKEMWKAYVDFSDDIRKFHLMPAEEKSYADDTGFTREVATWLLKRLHEEQDNLLERKNQFLKGILNELGRTYRVHGAEEREIVLLSLLTALDRFYDYVRFACEAPDGSLDAEKIKERLFPYIDRTLQAMETVETTKIDALLCELVVKWREAFIRYMDIRRIVRVPVEKGVQLPEETKKRITEAVTKALDVKERTK